MSLRPLCQQLVQCRTSVCPLCLPMSANKPKAPFKYSLNPNRITFNQCNNHKIHPFCCIRFPFFLTSKGSVSIT